MSFRGVIVALALFAASASAQSCFIDTEVGPKTCNCSPESSPLKLCSSPDVQVMGGAQVRHTSGLSGLTASAAVPYIENTSVGASECVTAVLPPFHCAWWEYDFKVCVSMQITEGLLFDHVKVHVDITYVGKRFRCEPALPFEC